MYGDTVAEKYYSVWEYKKSLVSFGCEWRERR